MLNKILFPKQLDACRQADARLNIWEGSVSSGKTYNSIWKWLSWLAHEAPHTGAFLMAGKTERTLQRNILDPIQDMIGSSRFHINKGSGEVNFFGRKIYLVGANDERAQEKIRGVTLAGAYGDEITLWPESFFKMLLSRLRIKGARLYGTTNPDGPYHWLKVDFLDREEELNLKRFIFRLRDNTTLDPEYVRSLEAEYTGLWYRRFIDGEWCQAEGAIYDMFDEKIHIVRTEDIEKDGNKCRRQCVAVDYGTSNPTAALLVKEYQPCRYHVADEYYYDGRSAQKQKTDKEYISDFTAFYEKNSIEKRDAPLIIDPSAASLKAEARQNGFRVENADNSVLDGIRFVATRLSARELTISPACQNLSREMVSYVWDSSAQKRGEDIPKKVNDHGCDALRYSVMYLARGQVTSGTFGMY